MEEKLDQENFRRKLIPYINEESNPIDLTYSAIDYYLEHKHIHGLTLLQSFCNDTLPPVLLNTIYTKVSPEHSGKSEILDEIETAYLGINAKKILPQMSTIVADAMKCLTIVCVCNKVSFHVPVQWEDGSKFYNLCTQVTNILANVFLENQMAQIAKAIDERLLSLIEKSFAQLNDGTVLIEVVEDWKANRTDLKTDVELFNNSEFTSYVINRFEKMYHNWYVFSFVVAENSGICDQSNDEKWCSNGVIWKNYKWADYSYTDFGKFDFTIFFIFGRNDDIWRAGAAGGYRKNMCHLTLALSTLM